MRKPLVHSGMCDASGAVAIDANRFLVASDENNTLRLYRSDHPGMALQAFPWDASLGIDPKKDKHPEVDIEAATFLKGRIYWISSHGRNRSGKWRPNRHRFFATTVTVTRGIVTLKPFGKPYRKLAGELVRDKRMQDLGLAEALGPEGRTVERLAPKESGLNIEGLCAAADGGSLWIGLRNPLVDGKALIVPLRNPASVLQDGAAPRFGDPILLKLQVHTERQPTRLGIRSIEYAPKHGGYLIAAGPADDEKTFGLFRWSGRAADEPTLLTRSTRVVNGVKDLTPEALVVYPHTRAVQLLSDDGSLRVKVESKAECKPGTFENGYCQAKDLRDHKRKTFKSVWIDVK